MERRWHGTEVAHGKALGGLPKGGGVPAGAAFFPEKCGTEGSGFRRKGVIFAGGL